MGRSGSLESSVHIVANNGFSIDLNERNFRIPLTSVSLQTWFVCCVRAYAQCFGPPSESLFSQCSQLPARARPHGNALHAVGACGSCLTGIQDRPTRVRGWGPPVGSSQVVRRRGKGLGSQRGTCPLRGGGASAGMQTTWDTGWLVDGLIGRISSWRGPVLVSFISKRGI